MYKSLVTGFAVLLNFGAAWAQVPTQIHLIVPFPAGGATDVLARVLADQIGKSGGPTIVVDNRAGASTIIGTELAAKARADGATLLMPSNSFLINTHLRPLPYNPLTSFEPVCHLTDSPQLLVVKADAPFQTLKELVDFGRARPGALILGANGPATTQHVVSAMWTKAADIKATFVPYPGGAPATTALLAGQVIAIIANFSEVSAQIKSGSLRTLAVSTGRRLDTLPDVPTLKELGFDIDISAWFGVVAPAGTPKPVLAGLETMFARAMVSDAVKSQLITLQLVPSSDCGEDFGKFLSEQFEQVGKTAKESDMKLE